MKLKLIEDNLDNVDTAFHALYTERNGKFEFTGVDGMKSQADIDRLQVSLNKERDAHKATRQKFSKVAELDIDEVARRYDGWDDLEAQALSGDKNQKEKIDELVERRLAAKLAPVERQRDQLQTQLTEASAQIEGFKAEGTRRKILDAVTRSATDLKLLPEAIEDASLLAERIFAVDEDGHVTTRDGVGVTPGIGPDVWLGEMKERRPHWWPANVGGGANGNRGGGMASNPWSADNWNLTEQGKVYMADRAKAEQMAKSAGTTIGGARPVAKK